MGGHFKFPIDVKLSPEPTLNDVDQLALYVCLRDVSIDSKFATSVLKILTEDRRTAHRNRWNSQRASKSFRGPFQIKEVLEANYYLVQRYNDPEGPTRKYKLLNYTYYHPVFFSNNHMDTVDQRSLNFRHAPVVYLLKRPPQIELYNEKSFPRNSKYIAHPSHDNYYCVIDKETFLFHELPPSMPTANSLLSSVVTSTKAIMKADSGASKTYLKEEHSHF